MILKEKERSVIEDLQTQEKSCVEKYGKYAEQARDPELKNLFRNIQQEEQKHYESLSMILSGSEPECNCNDRSGRDYQPNAGLYSYEFTGRQRARCVSCNRLYWYREAGVRNIQ